MELLTPDLHKRLLANGANPADHVPVVKFFNPLGAATWLISECDANRDTLFGLADLGFGCPELGSVSLAEIVAVRLPLGLGIARDSHFAARHPLSVYAEAARMRGHMTENPAHLDAAAAALAHRKHRSPP